MSDETTPPVTADGPVLCLCGNPDNCSCPPAPVTAEDGEEFTISREPVSPETARLVADATNGGGAAEHHVEFEDDAVTAEDLRERVAEKLWNQEQLVPWSRVFGNPDWRHDLEVHFERVDELLAEISPALDLLRSEAVAALAGDPGDLPARMAEAMRVALMTWSEGTQNEHLANAALSVRWAHAAHLAARVGDAERRAEHAESEHQVTQDRLADARRVVAALPDPSTAEELREKITELLGSPDEALLDAFLGYAWSETARIAGGEMTGRWQAEDALVKAKEWSTELGNHVTALREMRQQAEAERDALNACIRATCSAARIAREVGDHRKVVLLSDVERLLTVPELPPLSPPDGGQ